MSIINDKPTFKSLTVVLASDQVVERMRAELIVEQQVTDRLEVICAEADAAADQLTIDLMRYGILAKVTAMFS